MPQVRVLYRPQFAIIEDQKGGFNMYPQENCIRHWATQLGETLFATSAEIATWDLEASPPRVSGTMKGRDFEGKPFIIYFRELEDKSIYPLTAIVDKDANTRRFFLKGDVWTKT